MRRLYDLIQGYIRLQIKGEDLEKFLNYLVRNDIELWNVVRIEDIIYVNIKLKDFKEIRKYVRASKCKVRIEEKEGVPFLIRRLINRRMLVVGAIILVIAIYTLSSFVFFIEIEGATVENKEEVKELLTELKIRPGVLKSSIDLDTLEDLILKKSPQFAWSNAYFQGTKLVIELAEKELIETEITPSDIIADKSGIITELIVLQGTPAVEEGMTVKAGDLLISKEVVVKSEKTESDQELEDEEDIEEIGVETKEVKAEGIVKANVWYESYAEIELDKSFLQATANVKHNNIIRVEDNEFIVTGPKEPPYSQFKVEEEVKSLPEWRNIDLPIELVRRRYIELKEFKVKKDLEIAKEVAKERAIDNLLQQVSQEAKILNSELRLINLEDDNLIRVKALLEVEEDIGTRREEVIEVD
ncbi:sporulation protein YqfD [Natroniella sulfidigena]|uniref:sporulation protein YqfD n=1 Tax=Natroniella sulfidigena TaxID=723921 RepID=UPI002009FC75|nr:sporulation protein YqfD [Natroniella sulfidigena]MCK8815926.1 sporulation protein YqfD [Natroniella sulfidigena]